MKFTKAIELFIRDQALSNKARQTLAAYESDLTRPRAARPSSHLSTIRGAL